MINKFKKLDWGILVLLLLFMCISTMIVHSATSYDPRYASYDTKTVIFYCIGFGVVLLVSLIDYRLLLKGWYIWYAIGLLSLVLVFFLAKEINGARSWFEFGGLQFQPAEMVKIVLIIGIAFLMGRRQGEPLLLTNDVLPVALYAFIPFMLVMMQPDLGNAIIYLIIVLGMLWIGNVKYSHVLVGLSVVVGCILVFGILFNTYNAQIKTYLTEHEKLHWYQRINGFMNPGNASEKEVYQATKAKIAIGSGGLAGDGYLKGDSKIKRSSRIHTRTPSSSSSEKSSVSKGLLCSFCCISY